MARPRYWLYDWIEDAGVVDLDGANKALDDDRLVGRLRDYATNYHSCNSRPGADQNSILAGTGLDLTGNLGCYAPEWRGREVDHLFEKGWIYFDNIVVGDATTPAIVHSWDALSEPMRRREALGQIAVALRLHAIGADELVTFNPKPRPSIKKRAGRHETDILARVAQRLAPRLVESVARDASIVFNSTAEDHEPNYRLDHPIFLHTQWGRIDDGLDLADEDEARSRAVLQVLERYTYELICDLEAARAASLPIGSTNDVHTQMMPGIRPQGMVEECAFEITLPLLQNVPVHELLALRRDEADHFERLRIALRRAIQRKLDSGERDREAVARAIRTDIIEPELNHIRSELGAAKRLLQKRAARDAIIGGAITTFGFVFGMGAASLLGLLAPAALSGRTVDDYWGSQRDVEMKDLYFLWKADDRAHH
jgi:hypothetical protein